MDNRFSKITIALIYLIISCNFFIGCKDNRVHVDEATPSSSESSASERFNGMIYIPAGEFIMGNNKVETKKTKSSFMLRKPRFLDEHPQRKVFVDAFYIGRYEVTNEEYKRFVDMVNYKPLPEHWKNGTYPDGKARHPVIYVNWYDATFFARWSGKRLPTEEEWEKAARGLDGRLWTWGNEYDPSKGNFGLNNIKDTTIVGSFDGDKSPFGLYDVTGNVKEWTSDWYKAYPGNDFSYQDFGTKYRVIRGSSHIKQGHYYDKSFAMVTHRFSLSPLYAAGDVGIRLAASPVP